MGETCDKFNALTVRNTNMLLLTVKKKFATIVRSLSILSKNVLLVPKIVKLVRSLLLIRLLMVQQLLINQLLLQKWFNR